MVYVATFMKTLNITDPVGIEYRAPVLKAPEKADLHHVSTKLSKTHCGLHEFLPDERNEKESGHLGEVEPVQRPLDLLGEEPTNHLSNNQREQDTKPQLFRNIGVHATKSADVGRSPGIELGLRWQEGVYQAGTNEGA